MAGILDRIQSAYGDREKAIETEIRGKYGEGSISRRVADAEVGSALEDRAAQREYATQADPEVLAPTKEMLENLGKRGTVLEVLRKLTPEQREEVLKVAPGLAQQMGDEGNRGGVPYRAIGALSRGLSHGVGQPLSELIGIGGTKEEIEFIRQIDSAAAREFHPGRPGDPWYERGPLQALEMLPWMATIVSGAGAGRQAATGLAGKIGLAATGTARLAKAGEVAGTAAAAFPSQYAQEVDSLKQIGMEDDWKLRLLAVATATVQGAIEAIVPNPFPGRTVPLTEGAVKAARQYLWEAVKRAPGELSEEYFQGVTGGLGEHVAQYIDENAEDKSVGDAFRKGWEQGKEAALPMAFLLGVPAVGGAAVSAHVAAQEERRIVARAQETGQTPQQIRDGLAEINLAQRELNLTRELGSAGIEGLAQLDKPPSVHDWAEIVLGDRSKRGEAPNRAVRREQWRAARELQQKREREIEDGEVQADEEVTETPDDVQQASEDGSEATEVQVEPDSIDLQMELDAIDRKAKGTSETKVGGVVMPAEEPQFLTTEEIARRKELPGLIEQAKQEEIAAEEIEEAPEVQVDSQPTHEQGIVVASRGLSGAIYYGQPGETHGDLYARHKDDLPVYDQPQTDEGVLLRDGFATPDGRFLTRDESEEFSGIRSPAGRSLDATDVPTEQESEVTPAPEVPVEKTPLQTPEGKSPWQLTREQHVAERERRITEFRRLSDHHGGGPEAMRVPEVAEAFRAQEEWSDLDIGHKPRVRKAIKEGEQVPPEVLAEYPDLRQTGIEPAGAVPARTAPAPVSEEKLSERPEKPVSRPKAGSGPGTGGPKVGPEVEETSEAATDRRAQLEAKDYRDLQKMAPTGTKQRKKAGLVDAILESEQETTPDSDVSPTEDAVSQPSPETEDDLKKPARPATSEPTPAETPGEDSFFDDIDTPRLQVLASRLGITGTDRDAIIEELKKFPEIEEFLGRDASTNVPKAIRSSETPVKVVQTLTADEKQQAYILKSFGVQVYFYEGGKPKVAGWFEPGEAPQVWINREEVQKQYAYREAQGQSPETATWGVFSHELFHAIRRSDPKTWKKFHDWVKENDHEGYEEARAGYGRDAIAAGVLTQEQWDAGKGEWGTQGDEAIARYLEDRAGNFTFWNELGEKQPGLLAKIGRWLQEMLGLSGPNTLAGQARMAIESAMAKHGIEYSTGQAAVAKRTREQLTEDWARKYARALTKGRTHWQGLNGLRDWLDHVNAPKWTRTTEAVDAIMKSHRPFAMEVRQRVKQVRNLEELPGEPPPDVRTFKDHEKKRATLREWSSLATDARYWYEKSGDVILGITKSNKRSAEKIINLIAITSSQTPVATNWTYAMQMWARYQTALNTFAGSRNLTANQVEELVSLTGAKKTLSVKQKALAKRKSQRATAARDRDVRMLQLDVNELLRDVETLQESLGPLARRATSKFVDQFVKYSRDNDLLFTKDRYGRTPDFVTGKTGQSAKTAGRVMFRGEMWDGRKTNNFYINLMRNVDPNGKGHPDNMGVTVDVHIMRALGYSTDSPTSAQYDYGEFIFQQIANDMGWEPQQVQAAVWEYQKYDREVIGKRQTALKKAKNKKRSAKVIEGLQQELDDAIAVRDRGEVPSMDFADVARRHITTITYEGTPYSDTGMLPEMAGKPLHVQNEYLADLEAALLDENGNDLRDVFLGLHSIDTRTGPGLYKGDFAAGRQRDIISAFSPKTKQGYLEPDPVATRLLDAWSDITGLLFRQDAVAYYKPFFSGSLGQRFDNGIRLNFGQSITAEQMAKLENAIRQELVNRLGDEAGNSAANDTAVIPADVGVILLNTHKDWDKEGELKPKLEKAYVNLEKMNERHAREFDAFNAELTDDKSLNSDQRRRKKAEKKRDQETEKEDFFKEEILPLRMGPLTVDNLVFRGIIKKVAESEEIPDLVLESFGWQGNYLSNNWKENPNGEGYRQRLRAGGFGSVLGRVEVELQPRIDSVNDKWGKRLGGRAAVARGGRESGVPEDSGADRPRLGRDAGAIPEYGVAREGAVSYEGAHYSKAERTSLSGELYGTGLRGAEAKRLQQTDDDRLKHRVHFYIDADESGIRPEPGLGRFAHSVQLNNLYDPATKLVEYPGDANDFESAILDAGFDGWINKKLGMAVLLGPQHTSVPVARAPERDGLYTDFLRGNEEGRAAVSRQTDTPQFKRWFSDSKLIDDQGQPIELFHGTDKQFTIFGNMREPLSAMGWQMLTDSPKFAEAFAASDQPLPVPKKGYKPPRTFKPTKVKVVAQDGSQDEVDGYETPYKNLVIAKYGPDSHTLTHASSGMAFGGGMDLKRAVQVARQLKDFDLTIGPEEIVKTEGLVDVLRPALKTAYASMEREASKGQPDEFAAMFGYKQKAGLGVGSNIMKVFARMEKPLDLQDLPARNVSAKRLQKELEKHGIMLSNRDLPFAGRDLYQMLNDPDVAEKITKQAEVLGYDGLIFKDFFDTKNRGTTYVVFDGAQIKSATGNQGEFDPSERDIRYAVVRQPAKRAITKRKAQELDRGEKVKAYRSMQLIDGKLYPPMSAKVEGQLRQPTTIGEWEQSVEQPELIDDKGMFKLDKANKSSLKVRYNPYFHISRSPLNDQFSSAFNRSNMVTVEVEVPASELTSEYRADKAKDTVGEIIWQAGPVSSKLPNARKVILSRYAKVTRVVPDSEVAKEIAKMVKGTGVAIPANVVTPSLKKELRKLGVRVAANPKYPAAGGRAAIARINPEEAIQLAVEINQTQKTLTQDILEDNTFSFAGMERAFHANTLVNRIINPWRVAAQRGQITPSMWRLFSDAVANLAASLPKEVRTSAKTEEKQDALWGLRQAFPDGEYSDDIIKPLGQMYQIQKGLLGEGRAEDRSYQNILEMWVAEDVFGKTDKRISEWLEGLYGQEDEYDRGLMVLQVISGDPAELFSDRETVEGETPKGQWVVRYSDDGNVAGHIFQLESESLEGDKFYAEIDRELHGPFQHSIDEDPYQIRGYDDARNAIRSAKTKLVSEAAPPTHTFDDLLGSRDARFAVSRGVDKLDDLIAYLEEQGVLDPIHETTGTKYSKTELQRIEAGDVPREHFGPRSIEERQQEANAMLAAHPERPYEIIADVASNPRPLRDWEDALLNTRVRQLKNDGDIQGADRQEWLDLNRAVQRSHSEWGYAGHAAQAELANDFSIEGLTRRHTRDVGRDPTPKQLAQYAEMAEKISQLETEKKDLLAKRTKEEVARKLAEAAAEKAPKRGTRRKPKALVKKASARKKAVNAFKNAWSKLTEGRAAVTQRAATAQPEPESMDAETRVKMLDLAGDLVDAYAEPGMSFLDFVADVVSDMGPLSPGQAGIIREAWTTSRGGAPVDSRIGDNPDRAEIGARAKELMAAAIDAGFGSTKETWKGVVDIVHEQLSLEVPGISEYDTMQAMSDYGEYRELDKDEKAVKIRAIRGKARQSLKIEDLTKAIALSEKWQEQGMSPAEVAQKLRKQGLLPKATGREQATPDSIESALIAEVDKLKKDLSHSAPVEAARGQLQAALTTAKTAANNRLGVLEREAEALEQAVADREALVKPVRELTPVKPDKQLTELRKKLVEARKKRDKWKKEYEQIFPPTKKQRMLSAEQQELRAQNEIYRLQQELIDLKKGKERTKTKQPDLLANQTRQRLKMWRDRLKAARKAATELEVARWGGEGGALLQKGAKPLTDAQKIKMAERLLERRIQDVQAETKALEEGKWKPTEADPVPTSEKKERLKQELAQLTELRDRARQASPAYQAREEAKYWERYRKSQDRRLAFWQQRGEDAKRGLLPKALHKRTITDTAIIDKNIEIEFAQYAALAEIEKDRRANWNLGQRIGDGLLEASSLIPKGLMLGLEWSYILRQGFFYVHSHPIKALLAAVDAIGSTFSQRMAMASVEDIESRPNAADYHQGGIDFTYEHGPRQALEEVFNSSVIRWLETTENKALLPLRTYARLYAMFERGNRTFANTMKADLYDIGKRDTLAAREFFGRDTTWTESDIKEIARISNIFSGRGTGLRSDRPWLDFFFLARRWAWSRIQADFQVPIQLVTPQWLGQWNADRGMRVTLVKLYLQTMLGHATRMAMAYWLYALAAGDDEERKPTIEADFRSSDASGLRMGETILKSMGGLQPALVLATRIATGEMKTRSGEIKSIWGPDVGYGGLTVADFILNYGKYKLGTGPSGLLEWASGINAVGQPVTKTEIITSRITPLTYREIIEAEKELGVKQGTMAALEAILGVTVSTYGDRTTYRNSNKEERAEQFKSDLIGINWDTPSLAYQQWLSPDQLQQVEQRREERKQDVVYGALAEPDRANYKNDDNFQKSIERRDKNRQDFNESGWTHHEAQQHLWNHYSGKMNWDKFTALGELCELKVQKNSAGDVVKDPARDEILGPRNESGERPKVPDEFWKPSDHPEYKGPQDAKRLESERPKRYNTEFGKWMAQQKARWAEELKSK